MALALHLASRLLTFSFSLFFSWEEENVNSINSTDQSQAFYSLESLIKDMDKGSRKSIIL
jgi:hypothetical protein